VGFERRDAVVVSKRTIVSAPQIAMYPDAFYEQKTQAIYLAWEDGETIFFQIIPLEELA
jgi:hypothetical protein